MKLALLLLTEILYLAICSHPDQNIFSPAQISKDSKANIKNSNTNIRNSNTSIKQFLYKNWYLYCCSSEIYFIQPNLHIRIKISFPFLIYQMLGISTNIDIDAVLFLKTREGSIVVDVRPITKICKMPSKLFLFLQFYTPSQTSASASIP